MVVGVSVIVFATFKTLLSFLLLLPKSLIPPDGTLALMATFKTLLPTKGSTPRGGAAALTAIFMTLLRSR